MLWKSSKSVAFGRYDKYVIIWYCPSDAKVDDKDEALKNIGEKCTADGGANKCYNDIQVAAHNKYRESHAADALTLNEELANHIQTLLNADEASEMAPPTAPLAAPCDTIGFSKIVYDDDDEKREGTAKFSDDLYEYKKDYDFGKDMPKLGLATLKPSAYFTRMVWRGSTQVGFGFKGRTFVAGYCVQGPTVATTAEEYDTNVQPECVKDGYNVCFNNLQVDKHNEYRVMHENYSKIKVNVDAARELHKQMSAEGFTETKREGDWEACNELKFEEGDEAKVLALVTSTTPTDDWYAGHDQYDFETNQPKDTGDKEKSEKFTQVVWKDTESVGFAISGKTVIAWYCPKGNTGDANKFKVNVG